VSTVDFGAWEMQAGDPTIFAFRLAFLPNPHGSHDRATTEERESWGSFTVWAGGENLCAHVEQGEMVEAAHWYMLPLLEWLTDNWDPLLHEERLPLRNDGASAAESLSKTRIPPLSLKEVDDFQWLDTWSVWWSRHSFRSARKGGLFPDIYMRRYRDSLEVSTGAESLPGIPVEFLFLAKNRTYYVDLVGAAEWMFRVLSAAVEELSRRVPRSLRIEELAAKVAGLTSPGHETSRMAWLAGLGENINAYSQVAHAVDEALAGEKAAVREEITGPRRTTPLVIDASAYAQLVYGAYSPTTDLSDVVRLTRQIVKNYVDDASPWLSRLTLPLDVIEISQLTPGEQGSRLGEKACELLGGDSGGWVDVESVLESLNIATSKIQLSDVDVRAVSIFGPTQRPHVLRNMNWRWGQSTGVRRFTLAHELCHLLLDREYGEELAIATGPWAPLAIEQRANAFAAAFLMPTWLLRDALADATAPADSPETIRSISANLRVSASSLVDRLYNLGEISLDERLQLRSFWM
jgi:hypothetical protein